MKFAFSRRTATHSLAPLFGFGSAPVCLGSTRATWTRAGRKARGAPRARSPLPGSKRGGASPAETRSGRRLVRTHAPGNRNTRRVAKSAFRRHMFSVFSHLARRRKTAFSKAPPLDLTEQGRCGTENAFPPLVASRKRARDAAPRLPGRGSLPSIAVSTRHVFFPRRRRREEPDFVESVLSRREDHSD